MSRRAGSARWSWRAIASASGPAPTRSSTGSSTPARPSSGGITRPTTWAATPTRRRAAFRANPDLASMRWYLDRLGHARAALLTALPDHHLLDPATLVIWRSSADGTQAHAAPPFRGTRPRFLVALLSGGAEPSEWLGLGLGGLFTRTWDWGSSRTRDTEGIGPGRTMTHTQDKRLGRAGELESHQFVSLRPTIAAHALRPFVRCHAARLP
jgi:hypothetical protein